MCKNDTTTMVLCFEMNYQNKYLMSSRWTHSKKKKQNQWINIHKFYSHGM